MTTQEIDTAKQQAFAAHTMSILNGGALSLMLSIGHQTGLFDAMDGLPPSTSKQIADAAGLNERYVREWLGAMVTGRVIEYDGAAGTYNLPAEHAAFVTRAGGPRNLASFGQFIPLLGNVEQGIVQSFRKGGGLSYAEYPRFHQLMSENSAQRFDAMLIDVTLPIVPGIIERLQSGIDVADMGCGSGHAINLMAKAFPASRFVGYDFSEEGIAAGKAEAKEMGLSNAEFKVKDIAALDGADQFDLITVFDAIHDQAHPARVLQGISGSLKPGGVFLCADVAASSHLADNMELPLGPFFYSLSTMHCMTVSLALDGTGLGNMWGEQKALEMLADAGFKHVDVKQVEGDMINNYYIARKD